MSSAGTNAPLAASQPSSPSVHAPPAGRWQLPLLAIALGLLGTGLVRIAASKGPVSFEERMERVDRLLVGGALRRATAYLAYVVKDKGLRQGQRGEVHRRLAGALYAMRSGGPRASQDIQSAVGHYRAAAELGSALTGEDWFALAEATEACGRAREAYVKALEKQARRADAIQRRIVELQLAADGVLNADSVGRLDAILTATARGREARGTQDACPTRDAEDHEAAAKPANYLWALERKVEWILDKGDPTSALEVLKRHGDRLSGREEHLAPAYPEAHCQYRAGRLEEAEALEAIKALRPALGLQRSEPRLDRSATRVRLTTLGDSLLQGRALELADSADKALTAQYVARLAYGYAELAIRMAAKDAAASRSFHVRASESYVQLAGLQTADEGSATSDLALRVKR